MEEETVKKKTDDNAPKENLEGEFDTFEKTNYKKITYFSLLGIITTPITLINLLFNLDHTQERSGFDKFSKKAKTLYPILLSLAWVFVILIFLIIGIFFTSDTLSNQVFSHFFPEPTKLSDEFNMSYAETICPTLMVCPTPMEIITPIINLSEQNHNNSFETMNHEMIFIPGGEFYMGKSGSNKTDELFHKVEVSDFFIDKYEVSNAEYTKCVEAGYCTSPKIQFSESFGDLFSINKDFSDYPIVNVTWNQANDYCEWRGARLPTEAEFERAAGFNPESSYSFEYPWGNNQVNNTLANFRSSSPEPIDTYENGDNQLGVYNLVGNVWEWVNDNYSRFYYTEKEYLQEFKNPMGSKDSYGKVIKGGGWDSYEYQVTRYSKLSKSADTFLNNLGFRCANYSE